jgi:hypothetical protein
VKIYIDESGDLGFSERSSPYYVLAALIVEEGGLEIRRCFKRARERKLGRKLKDLPEFKFGHLSTQMRHHLLEKICACDIGVAYAILRKDQVDRNLRENRQKVNNFIAGKLIPKCCDQYRNHLKVEVIIDRYLNARQRQEFDRYFMEKMLERHWLPVVRNGSITIEHHNSENEPGLQAADLVAGAIHYWCRTEDPCFMHHIEPKVVLQLDFFNHAQK